MYQFWLNVMDDDAVRFLKIFTFLSLDEIAEIEKETERINQHDYAGKMADLIKESRIKETCANE